jgi:hypothetical protein
MVPDIGKLQVIEGFDADGKPKLRLPKHNITTRMLMLHQRVSAMTSLTPLITDWRRSMAN